MGLSQAQSQQMYGTDAYTGWDSAGAAADAKAKGIQTGGSGSSNSNSSSSNPAAGYIQAITNTISTPPAEYLKANPFYFDEATAEQASTAEYSPYYDKILSDYMTNINGEIDKAQGDLGRFLSELDRQTQVYTTQNKAQLASDLENTRQGYVGNGLGFSGFENKALTDTTTTSNNALNDYTGSQDAKATQQKADTAYNVNQYNTQGTQEQFNVGNDKAAAIAGGVQQRESEALNQYLYGAQTYYQNDLNPNTGTSNTDADVAGVKSALTNSDSSVADLNVTPTATSTSVNGLSQYQATTLPNNNLVTL